MADKILKVCVDRLLPNELQTEARRRAIEENPANLPLVRPGEPASIAVLRRKLWKPGRTLHVRFLDGHPDVQTKVEKYAHQWSEFVNIKFDFGNHANAEIRISFFASPGSWSYVGTDALMVSQEEPTMNYGWLRPENLDDEEEYSRVVLHEFGHALGAIHEHQHPESPIPWYKEAVYEYYMGPPNNWTKEQVDFNVLLRYSRTITNVSDFDPQSIMLYPIPQEHTCGDFEISWRNRVLSELDKKFMATQYPFPD